MEWVRQLIAPNASDRLLLSPLAAGMGLVSQMASRLARQRYQRVEAMLNHNLDKVAAEYQMNTGDFLFLLTQGYCPPGICVVWEYRRDETGWRGGTEVRLQIHSKIIAGIILADPQPWQL